ncbi:Testis-specific serine/threonine-protein kinase 2 [Sarcoptes scabiei]|uniref:Testis-specific serine/threonine-protein kinase 2 n=2 Tax=Sarcoptes scabiei TaxID=52283 RepID=A0A834V9Z6_SARSC|nr:Testis-specific serine/threonine-protein kinase 2 [Sarcoptes scabiei]
MPNKKSRKDILRDKLRDPDAKADLDDRTSKVFERKGYLITNILGAGSFGEVYNAIRKNNEICAVKVIDLVRCSNKYKKKFLPRELAALMETRHENIIRIYDIFRSNKKIFIFMEFASNGDLGKFMKKNGVLKEERARIWFTQTTSAINYLHEEMFTAHRDVKIENILLNRDWIVKITDFGFAIEAIDIDGQIIFSGTFCGTIPYYCIQILQKKPYNPFKADTWALGVVLYAMTHNRFPFHYKDTKLMIKEQSDQRFIEERIKGSHSNELKDLIMRLFDTDENSRFSTEQILEHAWIKRENLIQLDENRTSRWNNQDFQTANDEQRAFQTYKE